MHVVWITALGVGGATMIGAFIGFFIKKIPHRFNDIILGFAAGVMLCAAVFGLIAPALEGTDLKGALLVCAGVLTGAWFLSLIDKFTPHLHKLAGVEETNQNKEQLGRVLLFVLAIAIHNLPEGIAAGVSFGTGNISDALTVAGGIALQNIPEGMVIIAPMLAAGVSKGKTLFIALLTGVVEVLGTFIGYFAVGVASSVLPFALAFAGGTMLYVISDEMIPETHAHGFEKGATYSLLVGFCVMLVLDALI
ncbi:MAG: ZIP family metal transporter [Clostridia bacterium]|nr:ZIP family metal transporter [Clostridia bacterium]